MSLVLEKQHYAILQTQQYGILRKYIKGLKVMWGKPWESRNVNPELMNPGNIHTKPTPEMLELGARRGRSARCIRKSFHLCYFPLNLP